MFNSDVARLYNVGFQSGTANKMIRSLLYVFTEQVVTIYSVIVKPK